MAPPCPVRTLLSAAAFSLALAVLSAPVSADEPSAANKALAEALFQEGRKLLDDGKTAEACAKFEASNQASKGGGTVLNLGLCNETLGRTATAWAYLEEALAMATKAGRDDRIATATEHLTALRPRLSRITVRVAIGASVPGLEVRMDGTMLAGGALGDALPYDPGKHVVRATAPGRVEWTTTIELGPNADRREATVPALAVSGAAAATAGVPGASAPDTSTHDGSRQGASSSDRTRTFGLVLGGVGVAALGAGVFFAFRAGSVSDDAQALADGRDPVGASVKHDEATQALLISRVTLGVGIVATGVGAYLLLRGGGSEARPVASLRVSPWAGAGASGLSLQGRF